MRRTKKTSEDKHIFRYWVEIRGAGERLGAQAAAHRRAQDLPRKA